MKIGIIAGVNLSTFYMREGESNAYEVGGTKFGFQGGAVLDIPLSKLFYFQPGFMLIRKGMKTEYTGYDQYGGDEYKYTYTLTATANYIEIPLLLSVKNSVTENVAIRINAGPYIAYAFDEGSIEEEENEYLNGRIVDNGGRSLKLFKEYCYEYGCENASRFDYGLSIGGGVHFGNVYIGVFYDYGLANLYSYTSYDRYNDSENDREVTTSSMGLNVGYFF